MSPKVYVVRHAESTHNVTKDFSLRDPGLTATGFTQAKNLGETFPSLGSTGTIIASPLTRTIETTLAAFGSILVSNGGTVPLILDANLQERSALPCDTGSETVALTNKFPAVNFTGLNEAENHAWLSKSGAFSADDDAVAKRAGKVRARLIEIVKGLEAKETERKDVVVVTHGVFMKFLVQDPEIDLPKAGWKAFTVEEKGDGAVLVPV
ncbi:histidine phosphatase superfamily [Podospora australis]|uniref:Histidine phosphatase superfamily n=1 Tax=Podospora australis TaxID=1536484 RepID=A0AAN6WL56_9PEZI|nr:histidine phosphatase superfamily [Podospora australis]